MHKYGAANQILINVDKEIKAEEKARNKRRASGQKAWEDAGYVTSPETAARYAEVKAEEARGASDEARAEEPQPQKKPSAARPQKAARTQTLGGECAPMGVREAAQETSEAQLGSQTPMGVRAEPRAAASAKSQAGDGRARNVRPRVPMPGLTLTADMHARFETCGFVSEHGDTD